MHVSEFEFDSTISAVTDCPTLVRLIYPSIFVAVAVCQFAMSLVGVFAKWTQSIRDKEFLVELRLRNLDHPRKTEKITSTDRGSGDDAITVDED